MRGAKYINTNKSRANSLLKEKRVLEKPYIIKKKALTQNIAVEINAILLPANPE